MNPILNDIDELIGKYLAGEAAPDEAMKVEQWARESHTNREYLDHFRMIFDRAASIKTYQTFDEDAAWLKLRTRLANPGSGRTVFMTPEPARPNYFLRIAASIIVVLGIGIFSYTWFTRSAPVDVVANTQTVNDTLPDGSNVFLNKATKLTYAYDKRKKEHKVKLSGEAYFSIHHDDDRKFVVEVGDIMIRDIGTAFNVKAYPGSNTIEVVVIEGEVLFYTKDTSVYLRANGKGIYNKTTHKFTVDKPDANVLSYKNRFFVFSNTSLGEAIDELNSVYSKKITLPEHLRACPLTVTFNNEDLDMIVQTIAETQGLTVTDTGNAFVFEGSGCAR